MNIRVRCTVAICFLAALIDPFSVSYVVPGMNWKRLEQESGFFFNTKYFEDLVLAGEWEEVEKYLSGFTKVDDNRYSMKIFFEIRKQKYLEALDKYVSVFPYPLSIFFPFLIRLSEWFSDVLGFLVET